MCRLARRSGEQVSSFQAVAIEDGTCRQQDALGTVFEQTYSTREEAQSVAERLDTEQRAAEGYDVEWAPVEYDVILVVNDKTKTIARESGISCADEMYRECYPLPNPFNLSGDEVVPTYSPADGDFEHLAYALGLDQNNPSGDIPSELVREFEDAYATRYHELEIAGA